PSLSPQFPLALGGSAASCEYACARCRTIWAATSSSTFGVSAAILLAIALLASAALLAAVSCVSEVFGIDPTPPDRILGSPARADRTAIGGVGPKAIRSRAR